MCHLCMVRLGWWFCVSASLQVINYGDSVQDAAENTDEFVTLNDRPKSA